VQVATGPSFSPASVTGIAVAVTGRPEGLAERNIEGEMWRWAPSIRIHHAPHKNTNSPLFFWFACIEPQDCVSSATHHENGIFFSQKEI
jgi:hypothetical protein